MRLRLPAREKAAGVLLAFLENALACIEVANSDMPLQSIAPVLRQAGEKGDLIERKAVADGYIHGKSPFCQAPSKNASWQQETTKVRYRLQLTLY